MPNLTNLKSSRFLTKDDVTPDVLVTISKFEEMDVSMESQAEEMKWCLSFKELDKPLVLNMTNGELIADIIGSGEFDEWIGKQVVLYNDKTVMFAGKRTGGIRVRASKQTLGNAVKGAQDFAKKRQDQINDEQNADTPEDSVPF
ncbi:MAG: hypothetical protein IIC12_05310 [Proteobacteria bacterium]|nr:hypothetical protein [Pseudomonadota bacterium]